MVKKNTVLFSSEKAWTKVKYSNKKEGMTKKKSKRKGSEGRKILFFREKVQLNLAE